MHACLSVDEILRFIASELVEAGLQRTAVALACCCRAFEDPVLDALWETERNLMHLLGTFPQDIWGSGEHEPLIRPPTAREWARLWKYAQRVKAFMPSGPLPLQVLSVLQFHTLGKPLLPNLRSLHMFPTPITRDTILFIHLFLPQRITAIEFRFVRPGLFKVMAASMIANLSLMCPNLRELHLDGLERDPAIIYAVSHLITATRGTLRSFHADSPLTQKAAEILFKSPHLRDVHTVIDGPILLPPMELPNLTRMDIKFYHRRGWLQGFLGALVGKLDWLSFRSEFESLGGFLEAFERVALTTSIPTTLSTFMFHTAHSWKPNYRSLLRFTHLTKLDIEFSCFPSCSSTIDDDTITDLARALRKLEFLSLGGPPCGTPTGVTVKGLSALAYYCPRLDYLRIHFQIPTPGPPETPILASSTKSRGGCALTLFDVGYIQVPEESMLMVAMTLLRIFPDLGDISYSHIGWEKVASAIYDSKEAAGRSFKARSRG